MTFQSNGLDKLSPLGETVGGLVAEEGEAYEKRIQNLVFFAKHESEIGSRKLSDVRFKNSIEGQFSEQVRDELQSLVEKGILRTKTDVINGHNTKRYIAECSITDFSKEVHSMVETVSERTQAIDTEDLVKVNRVREEPSNDAKRIVRGQLNPAMSKLHRETERRH